MSKALLVFFLCVILFAQSQRLEVFRNQIQSSSKVTEFDYTEDGNHKTVINYKETLQEISGNLVRHVEQETFGRFSIFLIFKLFLKSHSCFIQPFTFKN
jgi:hypothetical protein